MSRVKYSDRAKEVKARSFLAKFSIYFGLQASLHLPCAYECVEPQNQKKEKCLVGWFDGDL